MEVLGPSNIKLRLKQDAINWKKKIGTIIRVYFEDLGKEFARKHDTTPKQNL